MKQKITAGKLKKWSCEGKIAHKTWDLAEYHCASLMKSGRTSTPVHVYKCRFCRKYHVGHEAYNKISKK